MEWANEEGFWFSDAIYGAPLPGLKARLQLDIKCPFFLITYTLPEEVYYLGFDLVFKSNWARGYTYKSDGEMGPGFYADVGRFATWHSAYAGAADSKATVAKNPVAGFSRTREIMAGYLRIGTSLTR